jgi:hypothetical protein
MQLNQQAVKILTDHKIDKSAGLLVLLGYYFDLDVDSVCPEEIIKAVSTTKIVERNFTNHSIKWNISLFQGQEVEFAWVENWVDKFTRLNPARTAAREDAILRMKKFFSKYPSFRIDDIMRATDLYFTTVKDSTFIKQPLNFIFEGKGVSETSMLLGFCQKVTAGTSPTSNQKGRIIT